MNSKLKYKLRSQIWIAFIMSLFTMYSCNEFLPDDMDSLGDDVYYTRTFFEPIVGRNYFYDNIINIGQNTSQPLAFKIVNVRDSENQPVTLFNDKFPVKVWKTNYDGKEKSIEEIDNKRKIEYRPIFEILENSGNFNYWGSGNSSFIKVQPDSGYVFDVEISNSGGRKYLRNLMLRPLREQPYSPINMDPVTGVVTAPYSYASYTANLYGDRTGNGLSAGDVQVYFRKLESSPDQVKTLSFSFIDSVGNSINPEKFATTNWDNLVHGFNRRIENSKVVYDVAYPIPLTNLETNYTVLGGGDAKAEFSFSRMNEFGIVQRGLIGFYFSIYEEANWEIQFRFPRESPAFD